MSKNRKGSQPLYEAKHGRDHCKALRVCVECGGPLTGRRTRWCSDDCVNAYLIRANPQEARKAVHRRDRGVCAFCGLDTEDLRDQVKAADRAAFAEYLEWWNRTHPGGTRGSYLEPTKYVHLGYARYMGPRQHVGQRPGAMWGRGSRGDQEFNPRKVGHYVRRGRIALFEQMGLRRFLSWWFRKTFWDADHVRPVVEGGGDCGLENLRTLCIPCHLSRSGRETSRRAQGGLRRIERRPDEACEFDPTCVPPGLCDSCSRFRTRARSALASK